MSGSDAKAAAAAAVTTDVDMISRRCVTPIPQRIGFIGSGKMAMALGKGFMADGLVSPSQVGCICATEIVKIINLQSSPIL